MWMFELRLDDGTRVDAYKHTATRGYLHLGADGRAFRYGVDGAYSRVDLEGALTAAFQGWERVASELEQRRFVAVLAAARGMAA